MQNKLRKAHSILSKICYEHEIDLNQFFLKDDYSSRGRITFIDFNNSIDFLDKENLQEKPEDIQLLFEYYSITDRYAHQKTNMLDYRLLNDQIRIFKDKRKVLKDVWQKLLRVMRLGKNRLFLNIEQNIKDNQLIGCPQELIRKEFINSDVPLKDNQLECIEYIYNYGSTNQSADAYNSSRRSNENISVDICYKTMEKDFCVLLAGNGIEYKDLKDVRGWDQNIKKYWGRRIFINALKYLKNHPKYSTIKEYFLDNGMTEESYTISTWEFEEAIERLDNTLTTTKIRQLIDEIVDDELQAISIAKFERIYDAVTNELTPQEIVDMTFVHNTVDHAKNEIMKKTNRIFQLIGDACDRNDISFEDYLTDYYQYNRFTKLITKQQFMRALNSLGVIVSDFDTSDFDKIFNPDRKQLSYKDWYEISDLLKFLSQRSRFVAKTIDHQNNANLKIMMKELSIYLEGGQTQISNLIEDDTDNDSFLSYQSFRRVLGQNGIQFKTSDFIYIRNYYSDSTQKMKDSINILHFSYDLIDLYPKKNQNLKANEIKTKENTIMEKLHQDVKEKFGSIMTWTRDVCLEDSTGQVLQGRMLINIRYVNGNYSMDDIYTLYNVLDHQRRGYVTETILNDRLEKFNYITTKAIIQDLLKMIRNEDKDFVTICSHLYNKDSAVDIAELINLLAKKGFKKQKSQTLLKELKFPIIGVQNFNDLQTKLKTTTVQADILTDKEALNYYFSKTEPFSIVTQKERAQHDFSAMKIKNGLEQKRIEFKDQFEYGPMNTTQSSTEICSLLQKINVYRDAKLMAMLETCYAESGIEIVQLEKLQELVELSRPSQNFKVEESSVNKSKSNFESKEQICQRIIDEIKTIIFNEGRDIEKVFDIIDKNNDKVVDLKEFLYFCSQINPKQSKSEITLVYEYLDKDRSNYIDVYEFKENFAISKNELIEKKVLDMQFASDFFIKINYVQSKRALAARELWENYEFKKTITKTQFERGLRMLNTAELDPQKSEIQRITEKLVSVDLNSSKNEIDFNLQQACLNKYQNDVGKGFSDRLLRIKMEILRFVHYDLANISLIFDFNKNGAISLTEFRQECKKILKTQEKYTDLEIIQCFESIKINNDPEILTEVIKSHFTKLKFESNKEPILGVLNFLYDNYSTILSLTEQRDLINNKRINTDKISILDFEKILSERGFKTTIEQQETLQNLFNETLKTGNIFNYRELFNKIANEKEKNERENQAYSKNNITLVEICEKIRLELNYDNTVLLKKFKENDYNQAGIVKVNEAFQIIESLGVFLVEEEEDILMNRLKCTKYSTISYQRIIALIFFGNTSKTTVVNGLTSDLFSSFAQNLQDDAKLKKVPSRIMFREFDLNNEGIINFEEFTNALTKRGFQYNEQELKRLFEECISSQTKEKISYSDFVKIFYTGYTLDVRPLINRLRSALQAMNKFPVDYFNQIDTNNNGELSFKEFIDGLDNMGIVINFIEFDMFFNHFDTSRNGIITLNEFVNAIEGGSYVKILTEHLYTYLQENKINVNQLIQRFSTSDKLSENEFRIMTKDISQYKINDDVADAIFRDIDKNGSGFVELDELEAIYDEENAGQNLVLYSKLKLLILDKCKTNKESIYDIFDSSDESRAGFLNRTEFDTIISKFLGAVSLEDSRNIFNEIDADNNEKIFYEEFKVKILGPYIDVTSLLASIRRVIRNNNTDLVKIANDSDKDKNKNLDFKEYYRFIDKLEFHVSHIEKEYIFDEFDSGNSRIITFEELIDVQDPNKIQAKKNVFTLLKEFKVALVNYGEKWKEIFKKYKNLSIGGLPKTSFKYFSIEIGCKMSRYDASELFSVVDSEKKSFLTEYEIEALSYMHQQYMQVSGLMDADGQINNQVFVETTLYKIKTFCNKNNTGLEKYLKQHYDYSSNGQISAQNLIKAFTDLGIPLKNIHIQKLAHAYQIPNIENVNYIKLCQDIQEAKNLQQSSISVKSLKNNNSLVVSKNFETLEDQSDQAFVRTSGLMVLKKSNYLTNFSNEIQKVLSKDYPSIKAMYINYVTKGKPGERLNEINFKKIVYKYDPQSNIIPAGEISNCFLEQSFFGFQDICYYEFLKLFDETVKSVAQKNEYQSFIDVIKGFTKSVIEKNVPLRQFYNCVDDRITRSDLMAKITEQKFQKYITNARLDTFIDKLKVEPSSDYQNFSCLEELLIYFEKIPYNEPHRNLTDKDVKDIHRILIYIDQCCEEDRIDIKRIFDNYDHERNRTISNRDFYNVIIDDLRINEGNEQTKLRNFVQTLEDKSDLNLFYSELERAIKMKKDNSIPQKPQEIFDIPGVQDPGNKPLPIASKLDNKDKLATANVVHKVENVIKLEHIDETIYSIKTYYMFNYNNKIKDIVTHFDPKISLKIPIKVFIDTISRDIPKLSRQTLKLEEVFQKINPDINRLWLKWNEFTKMFTINPENKEFFDYYNKNQYKFAYEKDFGKNIPEADKQNVPVLQSEPKESEQAEDPVVENMPPVQPEIDLANLEKSIEVVYNKNLKENTKGLNFTEFNRVAFKLSIYGPIDDMKQLFKEYASKILDKDEEFGRLGFKGFKDLINQKMSKDMGNGLKIMDATLSAFAEADVLNESRINRQQLVSLMKGINVNLTSEEEAALYKELDDNLDRYISEEELLKFLLKDFNNLKNNEAKKAFMKIRSTFTPTLIEIYDCLQHMPNSFIKSFTQDLFMQAHNLPSSTFRPILQSNRLAYNDILRPYLGNNVNQNRQKNNIYQRPTDHSYLLTINLDQASILAPKFLTQASAQSLGMSILSREVRVCLYNSSEKKFIGNAQVFRCKWNTNYKDKWNFNLDEVPNENSFTIRLNDIVTARNAWKDNDVSIVFEMVIFYQNRQKRVIPISCGWTSESLAELIKPDKSKFRLLVKAGIPQNPMPLTDGEGANTRNVLSELVLVTSFKSDIDYLSETMFLPEMCLVKSNAINMVVVYRQYLGSKAFWGKSNENVDTRLNEDVYVRAFLEMLNLTSLSDFITHVWEHDLYKHIKLLSIEVKLTVFTSLMKYLVLSLSSNDFGFRKWNQIYEAYDNQLLAKNRDRIVLKMITEYVNDLKEICLNSIKGFRDKVEVNHGSLPVRFRELNGWDRQTTYAAFSIDHLLRDEYEDFADLLNDKDDYYYDDKKVDDKPKNNNYAQKYNSYLPQSGVAHVQNPRTAQSEFPTM